jgi:hypothetical protein
MANAQEGADLCDVSFGQASQVEPELRPDAVSHHLFMDKRPPTPCDALDRSDRDE